MTTEQIDDIIKLLRSLQKTIEEKDKLIVLQKDLIAFLRQELKSKPKYTCIPQQFIIHYPRIF